jgi:hypothetical protein
MLVEIPQVSCPSYYDICTYQYGVYLPCQRTLAIPSQVPTMETFRVSGSSEKSRHIDTASDSDFNSIYGSDVKSLTGYESDKESLSPLTSHAKSPSAISPSKQPQTSFCVVRRPLS